MNADPNGNAPYIATLGALSAEIIRARIKFPPSKKQSAVLYPALVEEMLETTKAINEREGLRRIRAEVLQVACVAIRMYEELDDTDLP